MILFPLFAAFAVTAMPARRAWLMALIGTMAPVPVCLMALMAFNWQGGAAFQFPSEIQWLPTLGLTLSVGVDSVALMLVALTVLLGPLCVVASLRSINHRLKTYYSWLLVLQAAMTAVFCARDLLMFYVAFEFTLLPMYVLIAVFGSSNRAKAATKFFLYTFTGSLIALAGLVYVVYFNAAELAPRAGTPRGTWTLEIAALQVAAMEMPRAAQGWVLLALLAGFAVKVPLFPVHTWLPLAHTEAPTAGSVILAGVLLKLGTYGIYRFAMGFTPVALVEYAPAIAILSIIGILYGGLVCWVQTDVKRLIAFSSVAHLGFCILGLVAINRAGLTGSVLYMINHGLSTGALFLMIGMVYDRYHTRSLRELGGLASIMPVWSTFMVFFVMASVGLPGLNGFVSEFLCLLGAFQSGTTWNGSIGAEGPALGPWYAAIAGVGMIIAAIYLLYMVGKIVFGPLVLPPNHDHGHDGHGGLPRDLSAREIGVLLPLAALCLGLGIYPKPVIDGLTPAINESLRQMEIGQMRARQAEGATDLIAATPADAGQEATP